MNHSRVYFFLLLITWLVAGCNQTGDNSYFPLSDGLSWEYRIDFRIKEEPKTQKLIFSTRPPIDLDGQRYHSRVSLSGPRYFYQETDDGIVHVDPVSGDRSTVLAYPIKERQSWQKTSRIRILEVSGAFTPTFKARIAQPITMDYVIEATGETVNVTAGEFENCIRVHGKGRLFAGRTLQDYMGIDSIYIEQTEWYAPGTGLVKKVRTEYTEPNEFKNTYSRELLAFVRN
ncbi:MAG: hypothetical protein WD750_05605 [Gammaproteobacteria bacterium]